MSVSFDDETIKFAELSFDKGIYDDTVSVNIGFMHFDQVLECVVNAFLQPLHFILVDYLPFVELLACLDSRDFML